MPVSFEEESLTSIQQCARFVRTGGAFQYGTAVLNPDDDTDGDGLPNGWEQQFGLDPLDARGSNGAMSDRDGDGQTAYEEFLAGTDPTDPDSSLRFISILRQGGDVRLRWITGGGHTNTLESAQPVGNSNTNFVPVATVMVGGSGTVTNTYIDADAALTFSNRYYRVRLEQ